MQPQRPKPLWSPPAVFRDQNNKMTRIGEHRSGFIKTELDVGRLNDIHEWLWFAGRPMEARPLHKQKIMDRLILVTEQTDLHMLWQGSRILIKPLPEFLMDYNSWKKYLCKSEKDHRRACGLLLSYTWLVCYPSDLRIAKEHSLLPQWLSWVEWVAFTSAFLAKLGDQPWERVDQRYKYGELRIERINWIYRLTFRDFLRGYLYGYNRYSVFLRRNFAWVAVFLLYITAVLAAMQVGLGTDKFKQTASLENLSYGFSIFAILAPLVVTVLIAFILLFFFVNNLHQTIAFKKKVEEGRRNLSPV